MVVYEPFGGTLLNCQQRPEGTDAAITNMWGMCKEDDFPPFFINFDLTMCLYVNRV